MVVKMMRWRPWPPLISSKYEVRLTVHRLEGCDWVGEGAENDNGGLAVEIRWKGPKISLGSFRRTVKRNCTRDEAVKRVDGGGGPNPNGGVLVKWDEEFHTVCSLSGYKENVFHPWEINFTVLHGLSQGAKNKIPIIGSAVLNIAEYASKNEERVNEFKIPLTVSSIAVEGCPSLYISLCLLELRGAQAQQPAEPVQSQIMPVPFPSSDGQTSTIEKDEVSALKSGLRKVKIFSEYVSTRRSKKPCHENEGSEGRYSSKSEEDEYAYPFDLDSQDEFQEGECDLDSADRKSFSYGTLAHANYAGVACYYGGGVKNEDEDWIYYSNRRRLDGGVTSLEDSVSTIGEQLLVQSSKRSILPWRKRKLCFRSPKGKGEPLLKKAYGEEGGDDIDFDRRQLSSDDSLSFARHKSDEDSNAKRSSVSEFGDDSFAVGTWEQKGITSRDGRMKIQTQVFFASIDQCSERTAGESACATLVAVIADWLQNNPNLMPIKSQFDSLIRDGSLEWRNLCENEIYREQFPNKHFDLETVLQAKIHDLFVIPEKSFIGFFHPDDVDGVNFDFLHGTMSFDNIWDEISRSGDGEARVFIISWNDHFFVLKVEMDAYYIIDTLGERLHEGCNQAYILKFDKDAIIYKLPSTTNQSMEEKSSKDSEIKNKKGEEVISQGKETCREYIKNFVAAIPIRELDDDIEKGLTMPTLIHHRLQIEFHFTKLQQLDLTPATESEVAA